MELTVSITRGAWMMITERWKSCSNARPKYLGNQGSIVGGGTEKMLSEVEKVV